MAKKQKMHRLTRGVLPRKTRVAMALDFLNNQRIRQLAALRIYHQRHIQKIDQELELLLKDEISGIDY